MKRLEYAALTVLFGGLIALGAAAGIRVAYGQAVSILDCTLLVMNQAAACQVLLMELNRLTKILLGAGGVAMFAGGVALYYIQTNE